MLRAIEYTYIPYNGGVHNIGGPCGTTESKIRVWS